MRVREIIFPFDDKVRINEKVEIIKKIVGEENVNDNFIDSERIPLVEFKCNKKQWKEIKNTLGLMKVYW